MTDCMETDVQILVHISAPSRAKDDARYRRQAQAFLDFETARRHTLRRSDHERVKAECEARTAPRSTDRERLEAERHGAQPASDQQRQGHAGPSLRALPSLILRSSPQNRPQTAPSTAAKTPFAGPIPVRRRQSDSWGTPPSVVPDSQPLVLATTNVRTESPVRRSLPTQSPTKEPSTKRRRIESAAVLPPTIPAPSSFAPIIGADSNLASVASPQLPSALSPSDQLRSRPTRLPSSPTPTSQSRISTSKQQPQPSPSHPPLRLSQTIHDQLTSPCISSSIPPSSHPHPHPHPHPDPRTLTHTETLTTHPPPPPTSTKPFKTHLTASLALLATHADLPKRYQPTLTTRPLRPLERGHWYLDCTPFPPSLRDKMWRFLSDFVGQGRAGWGVWCELCVPGSGVGGLEPEAQVAGLERGPDGDDGGVVQGDGDVGQDGGPSLDGGCGKEMRKAVLRIYCWGEIVPHIYVVLFLATSRMVKGAGATWVDGGGQVVVQMP